MRPQFVQQRVYYACCVSTGSCDVNLSELIPASDGITVLHYASREGLLAIVHMLLVAGAEHDVLDKEQNTPLMLAIQAFKNTVVKYLIKSGASITLKVIYHYS